MKSIVMCDQGHWGEGSGMSLLARRVRGTLAWTHTVHEEMYRLMTINMYGHQYLVLDRLCIGY